VWADLAAVSQHNGLQRRRDSGEIPPTLLAELVGDVQVAVLRQRQCREPILRLVHSQPFSGHRRHPDTQACGNRRKQRDGHHHPPQPAIPLRGNHGWLLPGWDPI
jgi:hypothetical protein